MDRRLFLGMLAAGALAALGAGITVGDAAAAPPVPLGPRLLGRRRPRPAVLPEPYPLPIRFLPPQLTRIALPGGSISALPGDGNLLALTVDDGASSEVVGLYAKFAADTGMRITFFVTGSYPSWTDNAAALRPLVDSGQVQLANHTWSHPNLLKSSDKEIENELLTNDDFIRTTFGVEARPYFRPPYGNHDDRVDKVAAGVGYTTPTLWYGSLADSTEISDADLMAYAAAYLLPQHIVIGHANYPTVTRHYDEIAHIIRDRGLVPITLDDLFERP